MQFWMYYVTCYNAHRATLSRPDLMRPIVRGPRGSKSLEQLVHALNMTWASPLVGLQFEHTPDDFLRKVPRSQQL